MTFIKNIFGSVSPQYLIRAYLISLAIAVIWFFANQAALEQNSQKILWYGYILVSALLFPFAKLVWDEVRDLIIGNNAVTYFGLWAIGVNFMFKAIVNVLLWALAIFIAPLGILYLWWKQSKAV
jgi:hypothetical protein